ncbi:MAG: DUF3520 domain-containing protein [Chloroflexi bacterium]|nr:DUF3520 domain-containing protein [Chloroflexota bacterium]
MDAGEVGAGHSVTALYELKLLPGVEGRVATVNVRYEDPDTGDVMEISREFYRGQISAAFEEASPRFQLDAAVAEYAEILRESYWALEGSMEDVSAVAGRVSRLFAGRPRRHGVPASCYSSSAHREREVSRRGVTNEPPELPTLDSCPGGSQFESPPRLEDLAGVCARKSS